MCRPVPNELSNLQLVTNGNTVFHAFEMLIFYKICSSHLMTLELRTHYIVYECPCIIG